MLTLILNQNPKVALMYECDLWNFPWTLMNLRFRHNWAERIEFYNQSLSRHQLVTEANPEAMAHLRLPQDLYHAYAARKGALVGARNHPFFATAWSSFMANIRGRRSFLCGAIRPRFTGVC